MSFDEKQIDRIVERLNTLFGEKEERDTRRLAERIANVAGEVSAICILDYLEDAL